MAYGRTQDTFMSKDFHFMSLDHTQRHSPVLSTTLFTKDDTLIVCPWSGNPPLIDWVYFLTINLFNKGMIKQWNEWTMGWVFELILIEAQWNEWSMGWIFMLILIEAHRLKGTLLAWHRSASLIIIDNLDDVKKMKRRGKSFLSQLMYTREH